MAQPLIKSGARGDNVKELQTKLQKLGFDSAPDGAFGPGTQSAIEELQTLFGYDVDGIVGEGTAKLIDQQVGLGFNVKDSATLKKAIAAGAGQPTKRVLKRGSEGADVRVVQRKLALLGFTVAVDGKYGDATEQAVRAVQQAFKYDVDGVVGEATQKLLNQQIGLGWQSAK